MATLTITVPDTVVPRIRAAFTVVDLVTGNTKQPTVADIQDALKDYLKLKVLEYEARLEAQAKREQISQEAW